MQNLSVPNNLKIKSFSFDARPVSESSESASEAEKSKVRKKKRSHQRKEGKRHHKDHKHDKDHKRHDKLHDKRHDKLHDKLHDKGKEGQDEYRIDRKGQENNIKYDTVYGESIPFYNRFSNQILGISTKYRISEQKDLKYRYLFLTSNLPKKRLNYSLFMQKSRLIIRECASKLQGDYIKLQDSDSDSKKEVYKRVNMDLSLLNVKVRENPHDIKNWMELVEFQNTTRDTTPENLILEKQLFILEKALEHLPENVDLKILDLKISTKLLPEKEILEKWDRVLNRHLDSFKIWEEYITFRKSCYKSFSFTNMLDVFQDCFQNLHLETRKDEENFLLVFSKLTTFMDQAGINITRAKRELL